ncbi:MAG: hypothetical protein KAW47_04830, partial [Thermoplasmatales archaeon]|nr:hypothetical protein [Thermoplasmatales archaeon]
EKAEITLCRVFSRKVSYNNFQGNVISFQLQSWRNELICNNFIGNETGEALWGPNKYDRNYWNSPRIFPKMIFSPFLLPTFQFDWHPAQKPYNIL